MGKIILLTGSPSRDSLEWSEEYLISELLPAFVEQNQAEKKPGSNNYTSAWRKVAFNSCRSNTGELQGPLENNFQATSGIGVTASDSNDSKTYYEQSFMLHEGLPSSQILESGSWSSVILSTSDENSFQSSSAFDEDASLVPIYARLQSLHLSHLGDLPGPAYLNSIYPQTMTVNLVVGIISISEPRSIKTRRARQMVDLVELTVGDDTQSGFSINIWLPTEDEARDRASGQPTLQDQTLRLRCHDVVLATRVALNSFRGTVYGQSLRKGQTALDILHRGAGTTSSRCLQEHEKVQRVTEWILQFVPKPQFKTPGTRKRAKSDTQARHLESLPDDTPLTSMQDKRGKSR